MHVYSIIRDIISQGNWKIVGPLYVCVCVCWQLKRSQRHLSIDRADPTSSTNEARRCSRSQCSPPAVAPKSRSPAQMMFIGQSIVFAVCLVADSETLRESLPGLYRVSIASLWGLFRVSALSKSALSVDLLLLMLPKVPPTWLVTEMRQMTNDLKFIIAARSLCSQTQTERNA